MAVAAPVPSVLVKMGGEILVAVAICQSGDSAAPVSQRLIGGDLGRVNGILFII